MQIELLHKSEKTSIFLGTVTVFSLLSTTMYIWYMFHPNNLICKIINFHLERDFFNFPIFISQFCYNGKL